MDDILRIAGAGDRAGQPFAFRPPGGTIWVFAGRYFRPTFLLALRRRSPDGTALKALVLRMPRRVQEVIVARYDDRDLFDVADWDDDDLFDHLTWMIEAARFKLYKLDADEAHRLKDADDPLFQHPDLPDTLPENAAPQVMLRQRRLELAEELGGQLAQRWMSKDAGDGVFWEDPSWRGDIQRALITTGGMMNATGDGIVAFVRGIGDLFEALWKVGKVVVEATGDAIRFTAEFVDNLSEGDIAQAAAQLNRVGIRIRNGWADIKKLVADGIRWLNLLNEDAQSRRILANYFIGLKGSISDVDRATLPVRVVAEFGLEIILTIAIGVVTGGVGAVVNVARKIGQFAGRAIELVIDIIKLLRRSAAETADRVAEATPQLRRVAPEPNPIEIGDPRLRARPKTNPHPGLHNREWDDVDAKNFKTRRPVDMANLSENEKAAVKALERQGRKDEKIVEVLSSGDDFRVKELKPGDKLYGFDDLDNKYGSKNPASPYWLDESGYQDVKARFHKDGAWDREGVKNYLALPCANRANVIDTATVQKPHVAVESTIGTATEQLGYTKGDYSTGMMGKIMPGGGTQVAPSMDSGPNGTVSAVTRLTETL